MCEMHYRRDRRNGDSGPPGPMAKGKTICAAESCSVEAEAKGYCHGHYQRLLRHGVVRMSRFARLDGSVRRMTAKDRTGPWLGLETLKWARPSSPSSRI